MKRRDLEPIILDTSFELFRVRGFDNVSVMDICEACDITKPTFYKYAVTKGDLLSLYFRNICNSLDPSWHDLSLRGSWWGCIEAGCMMLLRKFMDYGIDFCMQFYLQNLRTDKNVFFKNHINFRWEMIEVIGKAQESGNILDDTEPEKLYMSIVSALIGCGGFWIITKGEFDIESEFHRTLVALCEVVV